MKRDVPQQRRRSVGGLFNAPAHRLRRRCLSSRHGLSIPFLETSDREEFNVEAGSGRNKLISPAMGRAHRYRPRASSIWSDAATTARAAMRLYYRDGLQFKEHRSSATNREWPRWIPPRTCSSVADKATAVTRTVCRAARTNPQARHIYLETEDTYLRIRLGAINTQTNRHRIRQMAASA